MADTKVSALTAATIALAQEIPVNDAGASKKLTVQKVLDATGILAAASSIAAGNELLLAQSDVAKSMTLTQLVTYLQTLGMPRVKQLTSQHSISSSTATKVTGLDMTLEAGTYTFQYFIIEQSATVTVAPLYALNFTGTVTTQKWWFQYADLSSTLLAAIGTAAHDVTTSTLGFQMAQANDDFGTTTGDMHPVATTNAVQTINTDILVRITGLLEVTVSGDLQLYHGSETATATSVEVGSSLVVVRTA